jgi:hypothetical protein
MLIFVKREDPEIERAFMCLPGGQSAECPIPDCVCCGEVWGYMVTVCFDGMWKHEFRHRPYEGKQRKYVKIDTPSGCEPTVFKTHLGDWRDV